MIVKCEHCSVGRHEKCTDIAWMDTEGEAVHCTCRGDDHFDRIESVKNG